MQSVQLHTSSNTRVWVLTQTNRCIAQEEFQYSRHAEIANLLDVLILLDGRTTDATPTKRPVVRVTTSVVERIGRVLQASFYAPEETGIHALDAALDLVCANQHALREKDYRVSAKMAQLFDPCASRQHAERAAWVCAALGLGLDKKGRHKSYAAKCDEIFQKILDTVEVFNNHAKEHRRRKEAYERYAGSNAAAGVACSKTY